MIGKDLQSEWVEKNLPYHPGHNQFPNQFLKQFVHHRVCQLVNP